MKRWISSVFMMISTTMAAAQEMTLTADQFQTISFKDIPQTQYKFSDGSLRAEADGAASVLLHAFDKPRKVTEVSFEWLGNGNLGVRDARHEASKSGDDAWLRIGLMVHGAAPTVPFFAPAWIKQTRDTLKLPSDRMIYLIVGSKHAAASEWESPYSSSIRSIALASQETEDKPWKKAEYRFDKELEIVGLWLMVDSDNTKGKIQTQLRKLELK